jgi:hypothetical protein
MQQSRGKESSVQAKLKTTSVFDAVIMKKRERKTLVVMRINREKNITGEKFGMKRNSAQHRKWLLQ